MRAMEIIANVMHTAQEVPRFFGGLHFAFFFGVILASVVLCVYCRDADDKTFRRIISAMFLVMLVGEALKQLVYPLRIMNGELVYEYDWSSFPFQLCSTPIYVLPLVAFLPDSKVRDAAAAYLMTYGLTGGIAVYLFPSSVFVGDIFINYQTMVHHGIQIVSGIYIAAYYRRKLGKSFYIGAVCVFAVTYTVAFLLNTVFYDILLRTGQIGRADIFNMFYISPRQGMMLPEMFEAMEQLPPIVYMPGYFVLLSLSALLLVVGSKYIWLWLCKLTDRQEKKNGEA